MNPPDLVSPAGQLSAHTAPTQLVIATGTLEGLKWLALVLMTLDHINKYLFGHTAPALFAAGRIAMPLFVFVLAYNLAPPELRDSGAYRRTIIRLALYGLLASIPFIALGKVQGGWWPLNILFTLLVATIVIGLIAQGGLRATTAAIVVFVVGGGVVEYWWFAVGLAIVCWRYCKKPSLLRLLAVVACLAALWPVNASPWAFAAMPLILLAPRIELSIPRLPLFFYVYYPAHLGILFMLVRYLY